MKRLLCIFLATLVVLCATAFPRAFAQENPCGLFEDAINILRWHAPYWNVAPEERFPVESIMQYTRFHFMSDEYGELEITEGEYSFFVTYAVPAEEFEAAAQDYFGLVDLQALREYTSFFWDYENNTGIDGFQHYQPDREVYLFSYMGGMGDPSWYEVLGYTEEDGLYTVYSRFVSLMWEAPEGVEGEDYIKIGEDYFAIEHYLKNVMAISNGRAQFHSWEELKELPEVELTDPLLTIFETEAVKLEAAAGVFPADAVFEITTPHEDALKQINKALGKDVSQFVAYEILASTQPDGTVQVTFAIPEGFDPEKLALYYIPEDGQPQRLDARVYVDAGVIVAQLSHFSTYVLAELQEAEFLPGDVNGDGAVDARDARLVLRYAAGLVEEGELFFEQADLNGDGAVNARDARAILRQAAGLKS